MKRVNRLAGRIRHVLESGAGSKAKMYAVDMLITDEIASIDYCFPPHEKLDDAAGSLCIKAERAVN